MDERRTYSLIEDIADRDVRSLLEVASGYCDRIGLVVRPNTQLERGARELLSRLDRFLLSRSQRLEWPGTRLLGEVPAQVSEYRLCQEVIDLVAGAGRSLFSWCHPDLPEDLFLLREDGSCWLGTIAHERDGFLTLTQSEYEAVLARVPSLVHILASDC